MNNLIPLKYEIQRLVYNKKFFYLLLITGVYTYDVLTRLIIDGTHGTAPFSQWSYTSFITLINPWLLSLLVLLSISVFSPKEAAARRIVFSAPISEARYYLIKGMALGAAYLLAMTLAVGMSLVFYRCLFNFTLFGDFIRPILVFALPAAVFILGLSLALGKLNDKSLYLLLPLVFLSGLYNLGLPVWVDLNGNNLLQDYPLLLRMQYKGALPYTLPAAFIYSRAAFASAGIILLILAGRKKELRN